MKILKTILVLVMLCCSFNMQGQSLNSIKSLMEQGKYTEAAKLLRPLADGGNAEAQLEASVLFFQGKGVNKSDAQGIKYARMAAENGNDRAVGVLMDVWKETNNETIKAAIPEIVIAYVKRNPGTKTTSKTWLTYAEMLLDGNGIAKDEEACWRIVENSKCPVLRQKLKYTFSQKYVDYLLRKSGCSSLTQFITTQSSPSDFVLDVAVADYERRNNGKSPLLNSNEWAQLSKSNKYAQYIAAQIYYNDYIVNRSKFGDRGSACITLATSYSSKAYRAGVLKAKALADETEKYHVGQLINSRGRIFKVFNVFDGGRHCNAASKEVRVLSYQGMEQWRRESGFYMANNEQIMKALVSEMAKSGAQVAGGYWVGSAEVSEFDSNGNLLRSGYYQNASSSLGGQFKAYLILNQ